MLKLPSCSFMVIFHHDKLLNLRAMVKMHFMICVVPSWCLHEGQLAGITHS